MPELPDLQVFSRNLHKQLAGKTLKKVTVVNASKLKVPARQLSKQLEGEKLLKVEREGKELHFVFSNDQVLGLHLMLKGKLHLFDKTNDQKSTIIELLFGDGKGLALTDYQRAATPTLNPEKRATPDALSKQVDVKFLTGIMKSRTAIKTLLLDQKKIRGIGNAYADEILWHARISPFSPGNKIPADKIRQLAKSMKAVLKNAEKQILKTDPDIISGEVRDFLDIHHSKKTHSPGGAGILNKTLGGRITYYTDEQELYE